MRDKLYYVEIKTGIYIRGNDLNDIEENLLDKLEELNYITKAVSSESEIERIELMDDFENEE